MKKRYLNQQFWGLSLQECLEEMQILSEVPKRTFLWLEQVLPENPRIQVEGDSKFQYKPPYKVKNRTTLLALLKKQHEDVKGGVLLSDLNDCFANAEQAIKSLGDQIIDIPAQVSSGFGFLKNNPPESEFS